MATELTNGTLLIELTPGTTLVKLSDGSVDSLQEIRFDAKRKAQVFQLQNVGTVTKAYLFKNYQIQAGA